MQLSRRRKNERLEIAIHKIFSFTSFLFVLSNKADANSIIKQISTAGTSGTLGVDKGGVGAKESGKIGLTVGLGPENGDVVGI